MHNRALFHTLQNKNYIEGINHFNKGNYSTAKEFFSKVLADGNINTESDVKARSAYYSSLCAINLFHDDAEYQVNYFAGTYPGHPLINDAYFELGNYFYASKKYGDALKYYDKVYEEKLSENESSEFYFKTGYCYFMKDDLENARSALFHIKDMDTKYTSPALYYYSHINYSQKNYQTALNGFIKLNHDATFGSIVPYYVTQIYFFRRNTMKLLPMLLNFLIVL
ncbi:MAG: tetratricopeptide repeat protein [Bacteroidales bacterium]|nr:tetratricopeptide repeat protein [Bacteroidales bacterium]